MIKVVGIDEAGKGPVIGSMFIGFSVIEAESREELEKFYEKLRVLGVKDSKKLSPANRATVYRHLKENLDFNYAQLTPHLIDDNFSKGGNLNELEQRAIAELLEKLKPDIIYLDALTSKPKEFEKSIRNRLSFTPEEIISENGADETYAMVGAASILAKELREQELLEIKANLAVDVGSGYPSDPKTQEYIKENWDNEDVNFIFRKSWNTYKKYSQKTLNDF